MGIAIIIPDVNFSDANLGKVTLTDNVPVRSLSIIAQPSISGKSYQLRVSYYPVNTNQRGVTWKIVSGSDYASVSSSTGLLTIRSNATSAQNVVIRATSTDNASVATDMTISVKYDGTTVDIDSDYHFPFSLDGKDVVKSVSPSIDVNTSYSGGALRCNGSDTVNAGLMYGINGIKTVLFQFIADDVSDTYPHYILFNCKDKNKCAFAFGVKPSTGVCFAQYGDSNTSSTNFDDDIAASYTKKVWTKVAITIEDHTVKIFVNGQLVHTGKNLWSGTISPDYLIVGNSWKVNDSWSTSNRRVFKGLIKDVYAWQSTQSDDTLIELTSI